MKVTKLANEKKPVVRVGKGAKARTVVIAEKSLRPTGKEKEIPAASAEELKLLADKYPDYISK